MIVGTRKLESVLGSYGVDCLVLCLAVLMQHQLVIDGQTHDDSIPALRRLYSVAAASGGKMCGFVRSPSIKPTCLYLHLVLASRLWVNKGHGRDRKREEGE